MSKKKVFIFESACRRRSLDATKLSTYFIKNNHQIVNNPKKADMIFLFTCGFTDVTAQNSLKQIKKFQKYDAELIVAGCVPETDKEKLSEIFFGRTIATKDLDKIDDLFPENKIKFCDIESANVLYKNKKEQISIKVVMALIYRILPLRLLLEKIRGHIIENFLGNHPILYIAPGQDVFYNIMISRGCLNNCSYCSIRKAVGPLKSKPVARCIEEFKKGIREGYTEFVITADNTGAYGIDINSNFSELLDKITLVNGKYQLTIRHLSPRWIIKYLDNLTEIVNRNKVKQIIITAQSGSSRVLKLMRRYSDVDEIKKSIFQLKRSCPNLMIGTEMIIGFPTETEEDFKKTLELIKETSIDAGCIFKFSCKNETEAAFIEPKISDEEINRRLKYAKKYLKKLGYLVFYIPKFQCYIFGKTKRSL